MPWYKVTLSDSDIRANRLDALRDTFSQLHLGAGDPDDAAIFFYKDDLSPGSILYLSPGAARIAMQLVLEYSGVESAAPMRSQVGLLVGRQLAWNIVPFTTEP